MFDALYYANGSMNFPLVIEKLQNIVISEDAVKKGALKNADSYFLGEASRFMVEYIISESKIENLFETITKMDMGDEEFSYLDNLLMNATQKGFCPDIILHDYNLDHLEEGFEAIFPIIKAREEEVTAEGTALFHGSHMVGKLSSHDTKYLLMLLSPFIGGDTDYVLTILLTQGNFTTDATLHINRAESVVKAVPGGKRLIVSSNLDLYGYFDEMEWEWLQDHFEIKVIRSATDAYITQHIDIFKKTLSELSCDPLAIENQVRGFHHQYYEKYDFDEAYRSAKFTTKVETHITNEGNPQ